MTEEFVADPYFVKWVKEPDEESNEFWKKYMIQNPEKRQYIEEAIEIVRFLDFKIQKPSNEEFENLKDDMRKRLEEERFFETQNTRIISSSQKRKKKFSILPLYYKIAATLLIAMFLTATYYFVSMHNENKFSYKTGYGETKKITLPDNSVVTLNANSIITFSRKWDKSETREVWMSGEAFFNVVKKKSSNKKQTKIKFIVHTEAIDIEVLGTRFNVNNRRGKTKVVLNSGKIKLRLELNKKEETVNMIPGELVEFSKNENAFSKKKVNPEIYSTWQNNELFFQNQTLEEIAKVIEDQYGIKMVFEDKELASQKFTGTTPVDNLNILFTSLRNSFNVEITKQNNKLVITTMKK